MKKFHGHENLPALAGTAALSRRLHICIKFHNVFQHFTACSSAASDCRAVSVLHDEALAPLQQNPPRDKTDRLKHEELESKISFMVFDEILRSKSVVMLPKF